MKTYRRMLPLLIAFSVAFSPAAAEITAPGSGQAEAAKKKKKKAKKPKKGWYKTKKGNRQYYRRGKYVTGVQRIQRKYYYFAKNGALKKGIVITSKYIYYGDGNGVLSAMEKRKGKPSSFQGQRVKCFYYPNGKKMPVVEAYEFQTLQIAKAIIRQITRPEMTQAQKLKICFDWVISKVYETPRTFSNFPGWPALFANDHFLRGRGNCFSDGAAFAYLAKALGYENVYVCVDSDGNNPNGHCWAEIDGLAYDPLFAEVGKFGGYYSNYGARYGVYKEYPILHIKL